MNRLFTLLLITILGFSNVVNAEVYRISGHSTFSDGTPVVKTKITIECSINQYNCTSISDTIVTDNNGKYQFLLEVDKSHDGKELTMIILGEYFTHILLLESQNEEPKGMVIQDIELYQNPPIYPLSFAACCGFSIFSIAFITALFKSYRRITNPQTTSQIKNINITTCTICDGKLAQHLLIRHLIVEHDIDPSEAANLAKIR